ncbi:salicylate hydroxylase [Didymella exigua CBS 183.55]|uniref:Salicylate hydroxylase n=1 Tax=Didymella exigua CBS 183.55 TaxID=1150837 RepID=A0A6A5R9D5_9PLEO|nr:salicylate hydroxylase [Didymella exigua CBS 183.55]KAF1923266.1 salicylate hydroxylase [Didymella exigua CBS 183.55]
MGLRKKGVHFTLYEEASQYSAVGAGIGFGPNGLRAMDLIEPGFRPKYEKICVGNKPADAQHVFFEGLLLEEGLGQDQPWYGQSSWGHPEFTRKSAHRKALLDIMTSFIPTESVRFNKRLTDIEQHSDKVRLRFADGEVAYASVLAGADGITSIVRKHVLAPLYLTQVQPVYARSYCYRGVIPINEAEDILGDLTGVAKFYFGYRRSAVTYRITGGEEFNFLLCAADDRPWTSETGVTEKVTHEAMMAAFAGPGVDDRFRRLLSKISPIKWGFFHHPHTATYYRNRVAILGDSAHASLPFQAAGAAQGVEDAVILSNVLAKASLSRANEDISSPVIRAALDAYDSVRRPRAQKQLEQSAEVSRMIFFQHEEAGSDMGKVLPLLQNGRLDWLWFHDIEEDVQAAMSKMKGCTET